MRVIWLEALVLFSVGILCQCTEFVAVPKFGDDELASIYQRLNETMKGQQVSTDVINSLLVAFDEALQEYEFSIFEYFIEIEPYITKDVLMEFLQEVNKKAMAQLDVVKNSDGNEMFNNLREPFMSDLKNIDLFLRNMLTTYDNCLNKKDDSIQNMLNNMEDNDVLALHHNITARVDRKIYCKGQSMLFPLSQAVTDAFSERFDKLINLFGRFITYAIEQKQKKHYYISDVRKTWFEANRYCLSRNMRLVAIRSKVEWQEVLKAIEDGYAPNYSYKYRTGGLKNHPGFWTSGIKKPNENKFYWFGHSDEMIFTQWDDGEPNNWGGYKGYVKDENCIEIQNYWNTYNGLKWNDLQCDFSMFVICEY